MPAAGNTCMLITCIDIHTKYNNTFQITVSCPFLGGVTVRPPPTQSNSVDYYGNHYRRASIVWSKSVIRSSVNRESTVNVYMHKHHTHTHTHTCTVVILIWVHEMHGRVHPG